MARAGAAVAAGEPARGYSRKTAALWFAALVLAIFVLEFLRRPDAFLLPTLYAEDGYVFYRDQLVNPSWKTLLLPYTVGARYYLPAARLAAWFAAMAPTAFAPWILNGAGLLAGALSCSVLALPHFRRLLPEDSLRVILCFLFAVTLDNRELLVTSANCFWLTAIPVFLLAALPPKLPPGRPWMAVALAAGGLLLGLTTPGVVLAAPIALWQVISQGRSRRWAFPAGLLLAAGIQADLQVAYSRGVFVPVTQMLRELATAVAHRVVLSAVLGIDTAAKMAGRGSVAGPAAALLLFAALCGLLLARRGTRWRCVVCLYVISSSILASLAGRAWWGWFPAFTGPMLEFGGQRYFFWACCALALMVAWVARSLKPGWREALVLAVFAAGIVVNFPAVPGWRRGWKESVAAIDGWRARRRMVSRGAPAEIAGLAVPVEPPWSFIYLPGNTVTNGDFALGRLFPWVIFGDAAVSLEPHDGAQNVVIEGGEGGVSEELEFLAKNATYRITARARTSCGASVQALLWATDIAEQQISAGPRPVGCATWEIFGIEIKNTRTGRMRIHLATKRGSGKLYWSDVRVAPVPEDTTPEPANLTGSRATHSGPVTAPSSSPQSYVGVFRAGQWHLDVSGKAEWAKDTDFLGSFGMPGDIPVVGDWDGSGTMKTGFFRDGLWRLDRNGNGLWDGPAIDIEGHFGVKGDIPVVGDWTGSGTTKVGIFRKGSWTLDTSGTAVYNFATTKAGIFGLEGDIPVVGDWTGSGTTKVGVFRKGTWYLDQSGTLALTPTTIEGHFGVPGDIPVVGDWTGSGTTKVGVFRKGTWILDKSGTANYSRATASAGTFGMAGDIPVVGDWTGSGTAKVGVFRKGEWYLDKSGTARYDPASSISGSFGLPGDVPVVGRWK